MSGTTGTGEPPSPFVADREQPAGPVESLDEWLGPHEWSEHEEPLAPQAELDHELEPLEESGSEEVEESGWEEVEESGWEEVEESGWEEVEESGWEEGDAEESESHPLLGRFGLPAAILPLLSAGAWPAALALAVSAGHADAIQLTNIVFYFRHPEMIGRRIKPEEKELAREWVTIRDGIVQPALKALTPAAPAPATGASVGAGDQIPSSRLEWPGASPAQLAFMRAVYERHVERSRRRGDTFVPSLPPSELDEIEAGHQARKDAAQAARELLAAARTALAAEGLADKVRVGITSAYRSADRQFDIWQGKGGRRGFPYYYRETETSRRRFPDEHGPDAVELLAQHMGKYIAAPGYSNHQDGLAIDFGTGAAGAGLGKLGPSAWFHGWLKANAQRFNFHPYAAEAWHWVYRPPARGEVIDAAVPGHELDALPEGLFPDELEDLPAELELEDLPAELEDLPAELEDLAPGLDELDHLHGGTLADHELPAAELLGEAPGGPAVPAAAGSGARGKWVVLVAGFDYELSGVSFEQIALSRINGLIRRHRATHKTQSPSTAIATAPRFVLFDFRSGRVRTYAATQPKGKWQWSELAAFQPVSAANYTRRGDGRRVFDKDQAGRLSITDVYRHVQELGRTEPGSLIELSFLSHGWVGGPILVNSDDAGGSPTARDPNDKDARIFKDFVPPTMDAAALADFRRAFDSSGFVWVWGCAFAAAPRQVLHRVLSSQKYKSTRLGGLVDGDRFKLEFSREQAETFFHTAPGFFPARGGDGKFPLVLERSFKQIKEFFAGRLELTYCKKIAAAAGVPCFGALPGTYSDYEKGVALPVMVVPVRKPPYSDNFSRSIRFYTAYLGVQLDTEGRHYGRYEP